MTLPTRDLRGCDLTGSEVQGSQWPGALLGVPAWHTGTPGTRDPARATMANAAICTVPRCVSTPPRRTQESDVCPRSDTPRISTQYVGVDPTATVNPAAVATCMSLEYGTMNHLPREAFRDEITRARYLSDSELYTIATRTGYGGPICMVGRPPTGKWHLPSERPRGLRGLHGYTAGEVEMLELMDTATRLLNPFGILVAIVASLSHRHHCCPVVAQAIWKQPGNRQLRSARGSVAEA